MNFQEFVNREEERAAFTALLGHRSQRILLLYGPSGIGKSFMLHYLKRDVSEPQTLISVVDLRADPSLSMAERLLARLREQLGGAFAEQLGQVELQIQQELLAGLGAQAGQSVAAGLAAGGQTPKGGVTVSGQTLKVGGDVVGGDKITIQNASIVLNPGGGGDLLRAEAQTRRNTAFRQALSVLLGERRLILFLDHFEEATQEVAEWARQQLLGPHLDGLEGFANLWLIVGGQRVPLQEEAAQWRHILRARQLGPLPEEAIRAFWTEKRGLDAASLIFAIQASGGNPQLLTMMANNFEDAQEGGAK